MSQNDTECHRDVTIIKQKLLATVRHMPGSGAVPGALIKIRRKKKEEEKRGKKEGEKEKERKKRGKERRRKGEGKKKRKGFVSMNARSEPGRGPRCG